MPKKKVKKTVSKKKSTKKKVKTKKSVPKKKVKKKNNFDISKIKKDVENSLGENEVFGVSEVKRKRGYVNTGIPGLDHLFEFGIPHGSNVLVSGGAGSGKTILCLQSLITNAMLGKKGLYMSFEESEKRLVEHMEDFGWEPKKLIKKNKLKIQKYSPFDVTRDVEAMLEKEKGELVIDVQPLMFPKNFKPDFIVVDSLTALASAFIGKEDSYRIYIEQLFRYFEKLDATAFLITETKQMPQVFSTTGVEEFLADGVLVLYNVRKGHVRENAIEVLKMRGAKHQKRAVAMQITNNGIKVFPMQEIFSDIDFNK